MSKNWKNAEKLAVKLFESFKIPSFLESKEGRAQSKSCYDVRILVEDPLEFCIDSKYSKSPFRHHALLELIRGKYAKKSHQVPILYSKNYAKHGAVISLDDQIFAGMLAVWLGTMTKEEVLAQWGIK